MQENNLPLSLAEKALLQAETVLLRYHVPHGAPSINEAVTLLTALRGVTWRITLHADAPAWKLWTHLESRGVVMENILQQTTEFALRFNLQVNLMELTKTIANSVAWLGKSKAVPEELRRLNGDPEAMQKILSENWWLIYLFLLATSSAAVRLQEIIATKPQPLQPATGGNMR